MPHDIGFLFAIACTLSSRNDWGESAESSRERKIDYLQCLIGHPTLCLMTLWVDIKSVLCKSAGHEALTWHIMHLSSSAIWEHVAGWRLTRAC